MKYKILQLDANGRISFTKEELEKLLDEVYNNGYEDGRKTCQYTYPYWYWKSYLTTTPNIVYTDKTTNPTLPNDYIYVGDDPNTLGTVTTGTPLKNNGNTVCTDIPDDSSHFTHATTTNTTTTANTDFAPHWTAERVVYGTKNTSTDKKYTG